MAAIPREPLPEHRTGWKCSCTQPSVHVCHPCVTQHLRAPGQHHFSPLDDMELHQCSMCGAEYRKCTCEQCANLEAGVLDFPLELFAGAIPQDERANVEAAAKVRAEAPQAGSLQDLFFRKRNDFRSSIAQAVENMNGLEEAFFRALSQESELRICQAQLAQAREEIHHLQTRPQAQAPANEALVQSLKTQVEELNTKLIDQTNLQQQIQELTSQIAQLKAELQHTVLDQAAEQVKASMKELQDRLHEVSREAAKKVSEVIPLVSRLDRDWLDAKAVESFFGLASLGINEDLDPACMRQVARVCVQVARAAGPCPDIAAFADQVHRRLKANPEVGLRLVNQVEEVYISLRDQPTAKHSLQSLLRFADSDLLDDVLTLLQRLQGLKDQRIRTQFGDGLMKVLSTESGEWREALLGFPMDWVKKYAGEMQAILQTVADRGFDPAALKLVQLLQKCQSVNPAVLLSFVIRTLPLLSESALLFTEVSKRVKEARGIKMLERVFSTLRMVKTSSDSEAIARVTKILSLLQPEQTLYNAAGALVDGFAHFRDEQKLTDLVNNFLEWLQSREATTFAEWLLPRTCGSEDLAVQTGALLAELAKFNGREIEKSLPAVLSRLPPVKQLSLALLITRNAQAFGTRLTAFLNSCEGILKETAAPEEVSDRICELLKNGQTEFAGKCLECFSALTGRSRDAEKFTREALAPNPNEEAVLLQLLQDLLGALHAESQPNDLILRIPDLWLKGRQRLPGDPRMAAFCIGVLRQQQLDGLPNLLVSMERVFVQEEASCTTALKWTEMSAKYSFPATSLSSWLESLLNLRNADSLAPLFDRLNLYQVSTKTVASFVEAVLFLCTTKPAAELSATLLDLLTKPDTFQLISSLALLTVPLAGTLLDTARLLNSPSVIAACTELAKLLACFERDNVLPPDLTTLNQKAEDIARLAQACLPLAEKPAYHMTGFSRALLTELQTRPSAELLVCLPAAALYLLEKEVVSVQVEELGQALVELSRNTSVSARLSVFLQNLRTESPTKCLGCFIALTKRNSQTAVQLICEAMTLLSLSQDASLLQFLQSLTDLLDAGNPDLVLRVPNLWLQGRQRLPGDSHLASFCVCVLNQLTQEAVLDLLAIMERVLAQENVSYATVLTLAEMYAKYSFPAPSLSSWLESLLNLRNADSLAPLFDRLNLYQVSTKTVASFVEAVLFLCTTKPAAELSATLLDLLTKPDTFQLISSLALLTVPLAGTLLDTARLLNSPSVIAACTELAKLLACFERDNVLPPDLTTLNQKAEDIARLAQACLPLAEKPAYHMTGFSRALLTELQTRPSAELLVCLPAAALYLLEKEVVSVQVEELGQALVELSRNTSVSARLSVFLQNLRTESPTKCLGCFIALTKRNSQTAVQLICEAMTLLSLSQDASLLQFLQSLTDLLDAGNPDLVLRVPNLWLQGRQRLPGDSHLASFCVCVLNQLTQEAVLDLLAIMERVLAQENVSYATVLTLAEMYAKYALPANLLSTWLRTLLNIKSADPLAALFHRLDNFPQMSERGVTGFVEAVLLLCETKSVPELGRTLGTLLDQQEGVQLIHKLVMLAIPVVAALLDAVRQNQSRETLAACTELSELLYCLEIDPRDCPDIGTLLQFRTADLSRVVRACLPLARNPVNRMTGLCVKVVAELGGRDDADLLVFIPEMAVYLLETVTPDRFNRVKELGQLLIVASRQAEGAEIATQIKTNFDQVKDKLVQLLKGEGRIEIEALKLLFQQHTTIGGLVHVTSTTLRCFNIQGNAWESLALKSEIQANNYSRWVFLEDGSIFCCGGGDFYAGYGSSRKYGTGSII